MQYNTYDILKTVDCWNKVALSHFLIAVESIQFKIIRENLILHLNYT